MRCATKTAPREPGPLPWANSPSRNGRQQTLSWFWVAQRFHRCGRVTTARAASAAEVPSIRVEYLPYTPVWQAGETWGNTYFRLEGETWAIHHKNHIARTWPPAKSGRALRLSRIPIWNAGRRQLKPETSGNEAAYPPLSSDSRRYPSNLSAIRERIGGR